MRQSRVNFDSVFTPLRKNEKSTECASTWKYSFQCYVLSPNE